MNKITSFFKTNKPIVQPDLAPQISSKSKRKSNAQDVIVMPITLEFQLIAKFLCNRGLADKLINFNNKFELSLKREPTNKYDS